GTRQGYETAPEPRQQVHAREPAPLAVGGEQDVGLLGLDPAAPEGRRELCQPEVAVEPVLVAPEALEADDAERPRPEAALAGQPGDDGVRRLLLQPLEVERPADTDERPGLAGAEPEARIGG